MRTAYIAMGANLPGPAGPPAATLSAAASRLAALGRLESRSSLYSTEPVGFADQPRFLNAVVALQTAHSPRSLLERLLSIERGFGRDRSSAIPNGPRPLDLDILIMGDLRLSEPDLEIPHPRLADRAFVLVPLCEIAPDLVVPHLRATAAQLLDALRARGQADPDAVVRVEDPAWTASLSGRHDTANPPRLGPGRPHCHS